MKAQLLIDILSVNPEGEVYILDWSNRKEVIVQVNHFGQVELKEGGVVEDNDKHTPNGGE